MSSLYGCDLEAAVDIATKHYLAGVNEVDGGSNN